MRKHKAQGLEFGFVEEPFKLVPETSIDHDRVVSEMARREEERKEAEKFQLSMTLEKQHSGAL